METKKPRVLLVQFYSALVNRNENADATRYYDKLYQTVPGYNRFGPVWEIPTWIAEMKRNMPDARVTFARSIADVQAIQNDYDIMAFSALDCNWHLIRTIAQSFSGKVIVGGYCDRENLVDLPNVIWCDSIQDCCEKIGVPYRSGVCYSEFAGVKTIARLTLSTGCRHKCRFCIQPNDVVKTPVADVYQQADEICKLNSPLVYINDKTFGQCENFWLLPTLYQRIGQAMHLEQLQATFDGFIIQTTASQLLKLDDDFLVASGIRYVELGIETYNDAILRAMRKPARESTIGTAAEKLRRLGIKLIPNILIGLPGENESTYARTLHWLSRNADVISHLNIYNLAIYADAALADDSEYQGLQDNELTDENREPDDIAAVLFATLLYSFAINQLPDVCDDCSLGRVLAGEKRKDIPACEQCGKTDAKAKAIDAIHKSFAAMDAELNATGPTTGEKRDAARAAYQTAVDAATLSTSLCGNVKTTPCDEQCDTIDAVCIDCETTKPANACTFCRKANATDIIVASALSLCGDADERGSALTDACQDGLKFLDSLPATKSKSQQENREAYRRILNNVL